MKLQYLRQKFEPALRRVGFRGTLHVARQDDPLAPVAVVAPGGSQLALAI